ncbi:MAG TPA: FixH family protein [Blastocatellia bacterium]|nr:FixH family protein [Blastocatellia bacterium]
MRTNTLVVSILIAVIALVSAACGGAKSGGEKVIKSAKAGDMTVTLASSTGQLKSGDNELMLEFTDASGATVDVGAASLKFRMAAMGSMAEMNDAATLTTTDTPGKYRAQVNIEVAGTWEAMIAYQGPHGTGQATMSVNAK